MSEEFKCKDKFIMDNQKFLWMIGRQEKGIELTEYDMTPQDVTMEVNVGEEVIILGGWKFNVSRVIYTYATINDIVEGWKELLHENIPVDILFLSLFVRTILETDNPKSMGREPELVVLLKLCYWYYRCLKMDSDNNFQYKVNEIKAELGKGLFAKAEQFQLPIRVNLGGDTQKYFETLQPTLSAIGQRMAPHGFTDTLLEIRHSVWRYVSEFLFYSLGDENNFMISIIKTNSPRKTRDLYLNTIPSDVKTVLDKLKFQEKIEDNLLQEILFSLKRDKIFKKINEGLSQGGKIIILDATVPSLGYAINYYASIHNKTLDLQTAINDSIRYANSNTQDYAPVLIFAQSIYWQFLCLKSMFILVFQRDISHSFSACVHTP
ncbi:MAG: hypothetical protein WCC17_13315 [Candidatus Nitrosopolaris sp.]